MLQPILSRSALLAFLLLPLLLAGCGKRPSVVEAPDDDNPHHYPQIYPDPGTDPQPGYDPGPASGGTVAQ